jgi:hypothetical protein
MRVFVLCLLVLVCGCNLATEREQLEKNKPIRIAEADGVTLWKVKDSTPHGRSWLYFTTPNGQVIE